MRFGNEAQDLEQLCLTLINAGDQVMMDPFKNCAKWDNEEEECYCFEPCVGFPGKHLAFGENS